MNSDIKHSEEFRHIVGRFPKKLNLILTSFVLVIVVVCISLGWIIQSPEVVLAEIKVTAAKPPISLVSESAGKIRIINFEPQKQVKEGEYLAIIENLSNEDHIIQLRDSIFTYSQSFPDLKKSSFSFALNYELGNIQPAYHEFINILYEVDNNKNKNEIDAQIRLLDNQGKKYEEMIRQRNHLIELKNNEINIIKQKLKDDSVLFSKGMLIKTEYENSSLEFYKEKENLKNYNLENIRNKINISESKDNINLLSLKKELKLSDLEIKLLNSFQNLILAINDWEKKYVIKSPVDGKVDYLKFISSNQYINLGEPLFSVLPDNNKIIGQLFMPSEGAGKVKIGQNVLIKLHAFPYQEFGKLSGKIRSISLIPNESLYLVIVELPDGLKSDTGLSLSFGNNMEGEAEIITKKRRLLFKIFDKVIKAFDRKKDNENLEKK